MKALKSISCVLAITLCLSFIPVNLDLHNGQLSSNVVNVYAKSKKKQPSKNTIVYYVPKGKSYHNSKSCRSLTRSKTILSGSIAKVISLGKGDPCNFCYGN
ncbi:MAG: hypothetical protein RR840_04570 [Clostridium sp.]